MKKMKYVFTALLFTFGFLKITLAASKCDYEELAKLNKEASAVKVSYEEVNEKVEGADLGVKDAGPDYDVYNSYFKVNIMNLTNNLYVKVTNSVDNSTKIFYGSDAIDGVISYDWKDTSKIANLTINIYANSSTSCPDEQILVNYETLPMFNEYSTYAYCESNKDDKICQKYVTSEVTYDEFKKKADKYQKEVVEKNNDDDSDAGVVKFVKENKMGFIIGGSIIIVMGVVATAVVIKKRRSRLI